ncbi:MAG: hypothetical protein IIU70_00750 [Anaerotignum sp.]|nr:hypothetical protein [Anaerotignum sp.]
MEKREEMLTEMLGEKGQDALQMIRRMERLQRLMGTPKQENHTNIVSVEKGSFRSDKEEMITAALPFLDREYQKEVYVMVRLMEMRRVLQGDLLELREKQELPAELRRRQMLGTIQPYLGQEERQQLEQIVKIMDVKTIMGKGF